MTAHVVFAWSAIALAALHVAAALKHHFVNRDATLAHMIPVLGAPGATEAPPHSVARSAILGGGVAIIGVALIAACLAAAPLVTAPPPSHMEIAEHGQIPMPATTTPSADSATPAPQTPAPSPAPGAPSRWTVDQGASSIGFAYVYEDDSGEATRFNGRFTRWSADIRFDPDNLDRSTIVVRIETASANTGVAIHDNALPTAAWFDSGAHPTAEFRATRIRARGPGQYEARGNLTLRGQSRPVTLPFTLAIDGDRASVRGSTSIDRRDFGIGSDDAGDELISREIQISVRVEATRAS
jgi:polyisoprenoid-binding protein YceI